MGRNPSSTSDVRHPSIVRIHHLTASAGFVFITNAFEVLDGAGIEFYLALAAWDKTRGMVRGEEREEQKANYPGRIYE